MGEKMLTVNDLVGLDKVPHINDISLKLYKDYCTQILLERRFIYYFTDSTIFEVKFKEWGIYHMLSIQHINWKIKKEDFFKEIDNGLSFANFKSTPSINARFKNEKERITMFACIYNTLRYGQVFYVPSGKVKNTNNVEVDYIIYRTIGSKGKNIGIRLEEGVYVPLTILISKQIRLDRYLEDTEKKIVSKLIIYDNMNNIIEVIDYKANNSSKKISRELLKNVTNNSTYKLNRKHIKCFKVVINTSIN